MRDEYILAIDSFKGCMTSAQVEAAAEEALASRGAGAFCVPVSDGGEGMLDAFTSALGGTKAAALVHDPLMRPVEAQYGVCPGGTAIIETSKACGLTLVDERERDPLAASTYGVGELVAAAVEGGCRRFIIGLGGSGTSDCGRGMLDALARRFAPGGSCASLAMGPLSDCSFTLASDVRNTLYGPDGAAYVFAPQKGATADMLPVLDARARAFAAESARAMGFDRSRQPGAGAAGGLGYAFMQFLGARAESGADMLLDLVGFDDIIRGARAVITGEGRADRQTLMGKLPERVLRRAQAAGVPAWLMAGRVDDAGALLAAGFAVVGGVTPDGQSLTEAMRPEVARTNIVRWVRSHAD